MHKVQYLLATPTDYAYGLTSLKMLTMNPTIYILESSAIFSCWVIREISLKLKCVFMLPALKILLKAFDDIYDFARINLSLLYKLNYKLLLLYSYNFGIISIR